MLTSPIKSTNISSIFLLNENGSAVKLMAKIKLRPIALHLLTQLTESAGNDYVERCQWVKVEEFMVSGGNWNPRFIRFQTVRILNLHSANGSTYGLPWVKVAYYSALESTERKEKVTKGNWSFFPLLNIKNSLFHSNAKNLSSHFFYILKSVVIRNMTDHLYLLNCACVTSNVSRWVNVFKPV